VVVNVAVELLVIDAWVDVVIESLPDVVTDGVVVLEFVVPVSYFARNFVTRGPKACWPPKHGRSGRQFAPDNQMVLSS
jgi:hypothetical protein